LKRNENSTLFLASAAFAQQPAPVPTATLSLRQAVAEGVLRNPNRVRGAHEVTAAGFERGRTPAVPPASCCSSNLAERRLQLEDAR